jgi:predicted ATPase
MSAMSEMFFLLTGPPGGGKSTLLAALSPNVKTVEEPARKVLARERARGGSATGQQDPASFIAQMADQMVLDRWTAPKGQITLFDRGLPDLAAFSAFYGLAPIEAYWRAFAAQHRYNQTVFFVPFWEDIYGNDAERRATAAEAHAFEGHLRTAYRSLGYQLVDVPEGRVQDRAAFVRMFWTMNKN